MLFFPGMYAHASGMLGGYPCSEQRHKVDALIPPFVEWETVASGAHHDIYVLLSLLLLVLTGLCLMLGYLVSGLFTCYCLLYLCKHCLLLSLVLASLICQFVTTSQYQSIQFPAFLARSHHHVPLCYTFIVYIFGLCDLLIACFFGCFGVQATFSFSSFTCFAVSMLSSTGSLLP